MPRAKESLEPNEVQQPTLGERAPPLTPIDSDADWHETLDAGREKGPTSAHAEEGWRALKPF